MVSSSNPSQVCALKHASRQTGCKVFRHPIRFRISWHALVLCFWRQYPQSRWEELPRVFHFFARSAAAAFTERWTSTARILFATSAPSSIRVRPFLKAAGERSYCRPFQKACYIRDKNLFFFESLCETRCFRTDCFTTKAYEHCLETVDVTDDEKPHFHKLVQCLSNRLVQWTAKSSGSSPASILEIVTNSEVAKRCSNN